ncbi:ATP-binding protein [Actinoplanes sp. HUAS TT8]|uniref:sensor histidine kinase n=1 Tax=Actinoplanes sp. HUAS TT8 TaxID=3447453 RepID=UPI003F52489A
MSTTSTATVTPSLSFPLTGHAVLSLDADGKVTSYNEGARLLFALDPAAGRIQAADVFGPPIGVPGGVRTLLDAAPGRPPAWTGNLTCSRGPVRPFVVTATATRDPGGTLTVICGPAPRPDTGLPPDLARRIGHELRSSMTGIAGLAAIMARRTDGRSGDQLRRLALIEQNARAAITVVDHVVELSQLESGHITCRPEPIDPRPVIAAAIGQCTAATRTTARIHDTTTADDLVACTDPAIARPIIAELITNALVAGAATEVTTSAFARAETVVIEVADNGLGIPREEQTTIFDPFVRGQSAPDGAAGLGLHLARRRAQLIGAELVARSDPGSGSTFTLILPSPAGFTG